MILPMSCTETFGQLLQLIGTIQGGAKDFLKLHLELKKFEVTFGAKAFLMLDLSFITFGFI